MFFGIILIGLLIYFFTQSSAHSYRYSDSPYKNKLDENPIEILNRRLARGEIEEDEYYQKKAILKGD